MSSCCRRSHCSWKKALQYWHFCNDVVVWLLVMTRDDGLVAAEEEGGRGAAAAATTSCDSLDAGGWAMIGDASATLPWIS